MVLRFWDRPDLLDKGIDGVTAWLDEWYRLDPDHLQAWELWKIESTQSIGRAPKTVDDVPNGAGKTYLLKVKSRQIRSTEVVMPQIGDNLRLYFWLTVSVVVVIFSVLFAIAVF
jgi:hypothetical protein